MTSREYILDLIEFISNQIAITSHLQELINDKYENKVIDGLEDLQELLDKSIYLRREAMKELMSDFQGDKNYWCALKHSIANWGYATEILYAKNQDSYKILQHEAYQQMMKILSKFLNIPALITCGRCLQDIIKNDSKETSKSP